MTVFTEARKQRDPLDGKIRTIFAKINGQNSVIPISENNSHYKELMRQAGVGIITIQNPED